MEDPLYFVQNPNSKDSTYHSHEIAVLKHDTDNPDFETDFFLITKSNIALFFGV